MSALAPTDRMLRYLTDPQVGREGWPYLTAELPGIGGRIRETPEAFQVEEIPLYRPSGEGEHAYLWVEKRGIATLGMVRTLARALGVSPDRIGVAGLKDARAVTRQWVSVEGIDPEQTRGLELPGIRVLGVDRHRNKLKVGHLWGNRFRILIQDPHPEAERRLPPILEVLERRGVPNYYGPQRFGRTGQNHLAGRALLLGDRETLRRLGYPRPGRLDRRVRRLLLAAFQSFLFNCYLAARLELLGVDRLLQGDVAQKEANQAKFIVEDPDLEQPRVEAWEISPTGPIYGYRMWPLPQGEAARWEEGLLVSAGVTEEDFRRARLQGARRALRFRPRHLRWERTGAGIWLTFEAPAGCYATALLREIQKGEGGP